MDLEFLTGGPVYDSCIRPYKNPDFFKNGKMEKDFEIPDLNEILHQKNG